MSWVAAAVVGSNVVSGMLGADAAQSAADTQLQGTQEGIAAQERQYNQTRADLAPYRNTGYQARNKLALMMGFTPDYSYQWQGRPKAQPQGAAPSQSGPMRVPVVTQYDNEGQAPRSYVEIDPATFQPQQQQATVSPEQPSWFDEQSYARQYGVDPVNAWADAQANKRNLPAFEQDPMWNKGYVVPRQYQPNPQRMNAGQTINAWWQPTNAFARMKG